MKFFLRPFKLALWTLLVLAVAVIPSRAQTWTFSPAWTAANGVGHLANNNENRGIAYSAASNLVFVSTRASASTGSIDVFDGTAGTLLSGTNIVGGNLGIDQVGVGDDGVLYGMPLQTSQSSSAPITLYSWTNLNFPPYVAYASTAGDPVSSWAGAKRIGDTMAVAGSGTGTLILLTINGTGNNDTNFVLLHTADGVNFTPTIVSVPSGLPSTAGILVGISFYTNNTFLVQPGSGAAGRNVYLVSYPANFASQTSVTGTVLGSASALSSSADEFLNYAPLGQMLASVQTQGSGTPCAVDIFTMTNYTASINQLATTTFATPNANGNATGGAALGGQGKTNYLYVLESDNGVAAYKINFTPGAIGPSLAAPTGGVTNAYPPQSVLIAVTGGTAPFYYQWYEISGGATNAIAGATNSSYTTTTPVTNLYFVVVTNAATAANVVTSSVVGLSLLTPVSNPVVTSLWDAKIGAYASFLADDDKTRGIGYDTNSRTVVVSSETGVFLLNGDSGSNFGSLNVSGLFGGATFIVDQVGVADDGVVYAGNLAVAGQTYSLTQWGTPTTNATPYTSFQGDPGLDGNADRWGDNMSVRGAGVNTQILLASKGTVVSLLTTSDGANFNPTAMTITGVPTGFAANGIAFGAGNTFWAKSYLGDLYEIAFDPVALTNEVVFDYSKSGQIPSAMSGVAVDMTNNILAGVDLADVNNDLQLFQLTGSANPPVLFDQAFFPSFNANGNENAAIVMKYPRVYAVDVNNGIVALQYGVPATTPPSITQPPASQTVYTTDPAVVLTVGASGSLPLYYQWQFNGTNISAATNQSYVLSFPIAANAGSYDVVVHNIAGAATSAPPAVLTVISPVQSTNYVSNLWSLAPGSRPYLDGTTYNTRGLAYDTNLGYLYVSVISGGIFALNASNGADAGALNTIGLPTTGYAGFLLDQVGVADDGVVYGANLADTANGDKFSITSWTPADANPADDSLANAYGPGDPGNGSGDRWGDTMAVRGAGPNTQMLFGSYTGTNVVLFTTVDGVDFTPILLTVSDTNVSPGFAGAGIAFGAGNTFWAKGGHFFNLRELSFDTNAGTATVLETYLAGTQTPNDFVGLSMDVSEGILGGVCLNDAPNDFQLYRVFGNATPPALFNQAFFDSNNANAQDNAASTLKGGLGFALDVNNGIVALNYSLPAPPPPFKITSIVTAAGPAVVLTWQSQDGATYQVEGATSLGGVTVWSNLGSPVSASGPTTSYTDTSETATTNAAYYRVIGY